MPCKNGCKGSGAWIWNNFDMRHAPSHVFYHSEWEISENPSNVYLIYRFFFMAILFSSLLYAGICESDLAYMYFTNWSFYLETFYGIIFFFYMIWRRFLSYYQRTHADKDAANKNKKSASILVIHTGSKEDEQSISQLGLPSPHQTSEPEHPVDNDSNESKKEIDDPNPPLVSDSPVGNSATIIESGSDDVHPNNNNTTGGATLTFFEILIWFLMNIVHTALYMVAIIFWTVVYQDTHYTLNCARIRGYYLTHSTTAIFALVDAFVVAIPARLTHCLFPAIYYTVYVLFSYIYEKAGGRYDLKPDGEEKGYIYPILYWKKYPYVTFGWVVAGFIVVCLFHTTTCWAICKLRMALARRMKSRRNVRTQN